MFYVDDNILVQFGNILRDLRVSANKSLREVSMDTKIDITTLNRMEQGLVQKINPIMLLRLAKFFNTNVLYFYTFLEYVSNDEIFQYSSEIGYNPKINTEITIPLFASINDIEYKKRANMKKINLPFPIKDTKEFFGFYLNPNQIYIFFRSKEIAIYEIGIFKIDDEYLISKYNEVDNYIILNNILDNFKVYFEKKEKVSIIGKIVYKLKELNKI